MNETVHNPVASSLSTKVTVIVFWGLIVIGLVFATLFLHDKKAHTLEQREYIIDSIALQLLELQPNRSLPSEAMIKNFVSRLADANPNSRFEIRINGSTVALSDDTSSDKALQQYTRIISFVSSENQLTQAEIVIDMPSTDRLIYQGRKTVLLGLGATLLLFGVILKALLERILTQPLKNMSDTARRISSGDKSANFDEDQNDEFGYLGKFINEAINRLIKSEELAQHSKELAEVTLDSIADAVITTDEHGNITSINTLAEKLIGIRPDASLGQPVNNILKLINEDTGSEISSPVHACIEHNKIIELEENCSLIRTDNMSIPVDYSAAPINDSNDIVHGSVIVIHDMSVARSLTRELSYQASHDPLTGLYNRREFDRELQLLLDRSSRDGHEHTLCYLDLDQFKVVNDTCGHAAGDQLLQQLSTHLQKSLRKADVLARLGGDEFGLLLYHCPTGIARDVAHNIMQTINDFRFVWEGQSFHVGVSIGLAPLNSDSHNSAEILAAADMACYAAKEDGRNRVHVYRPDDEELNRRRSEMNMVSAVRKALANDNFELFAQPIVSVAEEIPLPHFEILIRMKNEEGGYVPPGAFLPALERYQLINTMDRWVIRNSIDMLLEQIKQDRLLSLSINLSGQSINEDSFLNFIVEQVSRLGQHSNLVCFEITETAAIGNLDRAVRLIETLHSKGCYFALDDFGTGVSSYSYLKNLTVDYVKIDGTFVKQLHENKIDSVMVKSINDVALAMGIKTIAEFVENNEIHEILKDIGVHFGQGYWYAAPKPLSQVINDLWADESQEKPSLRAV